jgi:ribonuclease P protein component
VGFTASKKVGKAVSRNRCKRRMRSLAHLMLPEILRTFPNFKGDIVLIAVPTTVDCDYTVLSQNFKSAISRCIGRLNVELNGDNNSRDFKRGF